MYILYKKIILIKINDQNHIPIPQRCGHYMSLVTTSTNMLTWGVLYKINVGTQGLCGTLVKAEPR